MFRGALLADFPAVARDFDDWLEGARRETTALAIEAQERLCDVCLAAGDTRSAVRAAERMVALDTLREDSHRKLMEAYWRDGRRADALRQYETCVTLLREALDVAPSAKSIELWHQLTDDGSGSPQPSRTLPTLAYGPPRIAVLPLDPLGESPVPRHLSEGLVDDIISQLAGLRELTVISHGTTRTYRDRDQSIQSIARSIDARYVVHGRIRRSGDFLRLTTELTEGASGDVLWSRQHDTHTTLSFADQDRIVSHVVHSLVPALRETEILRIRGKRTEDMTLYERVLLARSFLDQLGLENFTKALRIMEDVVAQNPSWGEAYAVAADCHGLLLAEGWSGLRDHHVRNVEALARRALELDHTNVRALTFYAHRRTIFHHDFDGGMKLFDRALEAAPASAQAWLWSSITYSHACDGEEAVRRAERALSLSPADQQA